MEPKLAGVATGWSAMKLEREWNIQNGGAAIRNDEVRHIEMNQLDHDGGALDEDEAI